MKRLLLVMMLGLIPSLLWASPLLTCDPYPPDVIQPTEFGIIMDMGTEVYSPAKDVTLSNGVGKVLEYDLASLPFGAHSVKVRACVPDEAGTGRSCSDYSPFDFSLGPRIPTVPRIFLKK